ncbi:MAG: hypothetical protein WDZ77_02540 [Candidatus Pacearchaeota archaeon]
MVTDRYFSNFERDFKMSKRKMGNMADKKKLFSKKRAVALGAGILLGTFSTLYSYNKGNSPLADFYNKTSEYFKESISENDSERIRYNSDNVGWERVSTHGTIEDHCSKFLNAYNRNTCEAQTILRNEQNSSQEIEIPVLKER